MIWLALGIGLVALVASIAVGLGVAGDIIRLESRIDDLMVKWAEERSSNLRHENRLNGLDDFVIHWREMLYSFLGVEERREPPKDGKTYLVKVRKDGK